MRFMWLRNKAVNCEIKSSRRGIIVALKNVVSCHKRFGGYCSTVTTRERTKIRWTSSRDLSRILWIQSNSSNYEAFKQAMLEAVKSSLQKSWACFFWNATQQLCCVNKNTKGVRGQQWVWKAVWSLSAKNYPVLLHHCKPMSHWFAAPVIMGLNSNRIRPTFFLAQWCLSNDMHISDLLM